MDSEYSIVAKLGGTITIPNNSLMALEIFEQLQTHNMIFHTLTRHKEHVHKAVIIARIPLSFSFGDYVYKMKKGDTVFLEIDDE